MSILSRLANLWTGFISLWITNLESKNPEIAYENTINALREDHDKIRKATSGLMARRNEIKKKLDLTKTEHLQTTADLTSAVGSDDTLAVVLIEKQEQLQASLEDLEKEYATAFKDAENGKATLNTVIAEIGKLKAEKDRMLARLESAEARKKINDMLDGLSVDSKSVALTNVRESINKKIAEADLSDELKENDLDTRLKNLRKISTTTSAESKLAQLKADKALKEVNVHVTAEQKK